MSSFLRRFSGLTVCSSRAGFAHQGQREKKLLKEKNAFNVSSFVLRSMMNGQYWPEGDEVYHAELTAPILLVHGVYDRFVSIQEDQRMAEVNILLICDHCKFSSKNIHLEHYCTPTNYGTWKLWTVYNSIITLNVLTDTTSGLPESHRRGKPHGDDGVPWYSQYFVAWIFPLAASLQTQTRNSTSTKR